MGPLNQSLPFAVRVTFARDPTEEAVNMQKTSSTRMIGVAIVTLFLYGASLSLLGTLVPELSRRLNLSLGQVGTIAAIQAIGLMLASLAVGPLIDSKGKKVSLLIGIGLIVLALFSLPHSTGWQSVAAFMFVLGLGMAIVLVAGNSLAADVSEEKRGSLVTLANVFYGVGGFFTPFVAGHFLQGNGTKLTYFVASMAALIFVLTLLVPLPPPSHEHHFHLSATFRMRGKPLLLMLSLFAIFYVSCEVSFWDFLPKFLESQGIQPERALTILAVGFGLGIVVGRIVSVAVLTKISSHTASLVGSLLLIFLSGLLLNTSDPSIAGIVVFCTGFVLGPIMPCVLAMVGDAFPQMMGTCLGVVVTAGFIGASLSTRIIGQLSQATSLRTALMLIPAFAAAMVIIDILLRPMLGRARAEVVAL